MARVQNNRAVDQAEFEAEVEKAPKTKAGQYRATERGYAGGNIIEAGQLVPGDTPVSENWMEKIKGTEDKAARAVEDAQAVRKDDPDLEGANIGALQALAIDAGVTDVKGLSKKDLIAAIKAAREQRRL